MFFLASIMPKDRGINPYHVLQLIWCADSFKNDIRYDFAHFLIKKYAQGKP
jgi:hypothetical protein